MIGSMEAIAKYVLSFGVPVATFFDAAWQKGPPDGLFGSGTTGRLEQMKTRSFAIMASALALECAAFVMTRQNRGPIVRRCLSKSSLYSAHGDNALQPGDYVIKELSNQDKPRPSHL